MSIWFDQVFSRKDTCAVKFDARKAVFGRDDVIPLWVADMDFAAPEAITRALEERAQHPAYGYTLFPESLYQALMEWFRQRHGWTMARESILMAPGVVPSLHAAAVAFAAPGEGVIIQPPVYPPFFGAVEKTGRRLVENPLVQRDGRYEMDFEHLEACAREPDVRLLVLCSPHNPVGRVWSASELERVLAIARRHGLVVLSDEIHADLVYPDGPGHTVMATLATDDDALVTAVAPSKTFNIPGLGLSALATPRRDLRQALKQTFDAMHMLQCNPFSIAAFEAGYREGSDWLEGLLTYLQHNRDMVKAYLARYLPEITVVAPEGTYLLWLDCQGLEMTDAQLRTFFVEQARVGMNPGISFGSQGSGFMRMNIGSPETILAGALEQIREAVVQWRNNP